MILVHQKSGIKVVSARDEEIKKRIKSINWKLYETAYGNANDDIPVLAKNEDLLPKMETQLLQLFSNNHTEAIESCLF